MIRQAASPALLVDGRKFERQGLSVIAHVSEMSLVMIADARQSNVEALQDLGVAVQTV
jgi:DeoR/GlpR family transcriptional regulator of sugar metabolism